MEQQSCIDEEKTDRILLVGLVASYLEFVRPKPLSINEEISNSWGKSIVLGITQAWETKIWESWVSLLNNALLGFPSECISSIHQ